MRQPRRYVFYGVMAIYAIYNMCWLIGTSFSWGRNDTWKEAAYLLLTFTADIPTLFLAERRPGVGLFLFLSVLIGSLTLGALSQVINGFSLLYWYAPKLIPAAVSISAVDRFW